MSGTGTFILQINRDGDLSYNYELSLSINGSSDRVAERLRLLEPKVCRSGRPFVPRECRYGLQLPA
jgi:hypothetical protein